jgi:formylglycine-generating enzyme required for sulfatase activity
MRSFSRCCLAIVLLGMTVCTLWLSAPCWPAAAQGGIKIERRKKPATVPAPKPRPSTPTQRAGPEIEMVYVTGGSFLMGAPSKEPNSDAAEGPQRRVSVSGFSISKYEITQAQWEAAMGTNPSNFKGADLPVENVSWNDAKEFCRRLLQLTGKQYRLPTEAEWEYACRAGTTGPYAGELDAMAWYDKNSGGKTHPVGQKKPNAFGLYDMHGNVWEWCEDRWHKNYEGAPADGAAWLSGGKSNDRVLRGGSWVGDARNCRSALRVHNAPGSRISSFGFRVVVAAKIP